ncbi:MAG: chromosome condensation regulator [Hyperionvirus sp.]|uniref:Chromosome condensation regulator n=1 Tax=Hyperionvirus sp. TaxID=2487770 RepID=A0A3G5A9B3_9VIRU|nr:MAG: chromosome condensation regulator [Hyperionvirus sp.]
MDLASLFRELPIDIRYVIIGYEYRVLFIVSTLERAKYDWFKLIKMNFGLSYGRDLSKNEEIMSVYLMNCRKERLDIEGSYECEFKRLEDGTLVSRGRNSYGQLGVGDCLVRDLFSEIVGIGKNVVEVKCCSTHTIIRFPDGKLMGCGFNKYGQLGVGDGVNRNVLVEIKGVGKNIAEIICVFRMTIIRFMDGTLMSCGDNRFGQLGLGDFRNRDVFQEIVGIPKNIVEVKSCNSRVIIRLTDGTLMGCGYNKDGQLGVGDSSNRNTFCEIKSIPKNIAQVTCYLDSTILRLTDGIIMCTGRNQWGPIELGHNLTRNVFTRK